MKTLEEAIAHCKEKAAELREYSDVLSETSTTPKGKEISDCLECAEEHEQLAEWLKELKERRKTMEMIKKHYVLIRLEEVGLEEEQEAKNDNRNTRR